jgi:ribosomal protein S18 acetylase RimI-like enzyme
VTIAADPFLALVARLDGAPRGGGADAVSWTSGDARFLRAPLFGDAQGRPRGDRTAAADRRREEFEIDSWRDGDIERAAALLHVAYPPEVGRHFAPHGTRHEWVRYVAALVTEAPCGTLDRRATRVVRDGDRLRALALVTSVAPAIAHLAQLAVAPDSRRQGLATWLVRDAIARTAAAGSHIITLLVASSNAPARRLYESLGFREFSASRQ